MSYCGFRNCKQNPQSVNKIRKLYVDSAFCLRIPFTFMYMCSKTFRNIYFIYWSPEKSTSITTLNNYQLKYQKFGPNTCQPNFDLKSCQFRSNLQSQFTRIGIY